MNRKALSVAIVSALYGATIAASATSLNQMRQDNLLQELVPVMTPVAQTQPQSIHAGASAGVFPGGRNMQIAPANAAAKFKAEADQAGKSDTYIVRLRDLPVATYDGRVAGFEATAQASIRRELAFAQTPAAAGVTPLQQQLQTDHISAEAVKELQQDRISQYENYLSAKQDNVLQLAQSIGVQQDASSRYTHALNGFALTMTQEQAAQLAESPEVAFVQRAEMLHIQTDRGPEFIGAKKVWVGQTPDKSKFKGDGVIVGILDTGINSDHIAFQDLGENGGNGYDHSNPLGKGNYLGECATGVKQCNDKLIGIYSWPAVTNSYAGKAPATGEDYNGHGSHVAGTAAGNEILNVPMLSGGAGKHDGRPYGVEFASAAGVAPNANIVSYQVCLANGGCPQEAMLLAYEQAIKDGVDVINFSIGGGEQFPWEDPLQQALLSAREAGIAVAVAAGNNGGNPLAPNFYSISHSSPWTMVVAASTHDRTLVKTNNGVAFSGGKRAPSVSYLPNRPADDAIAGYSQGSITGKPVVAADYNDPLCLKPFAAGTFKADEIVICKRGNNGRIEKSENVKAGGAGGFILYNDVFDATVPDNNQIVDDFFELPGLHITNAAGNQILNWLKDGNTDHQITIQGGSITIGVDPKAADILAPFSSLGPSSTYLHHMAPNVSAPGVDILAPYADEHPLDPAGATTSRDWALVSGTSMASPHVAGAMALIRQAHPTWTAAEIQSALEMTASNTVKRGIPNTGAIFPATQHRAGAGRIDVHAAINAGLVMDETVENFIAANPKQAGDVRQLNLPQLVDSTCRRGVCSWTRTVKATRDGSWTLSGGEWSYDRWNSSHLGEMEMNNAKLEFFPAKFSLKAGESQTIIIKANVQDVQWKSANHLSSEDMQLQAFELWSQVYLTPDNKELPAAHWPVSVNFDRLGLPEWISAKAHRNNGTYRISDLLLPATDNLVFNTVGQAVADTFELTLAQDKDTIPVYQDNDYSPGHIDTRIINVPANSSRLVVEVLEQTKGFGPWKTQADISGALVVFVGKDSNNDGKADFNSEWLCGSMTYIEMNYCSLNDPEPGNYWVMLVNSRTHAPHGQVIPNLQDSYRVATAVVPNAPGNISATGPTVSDGVNPVGIDVKWNMPELKKGDIVYSAVKAGTAGAPGSIGTIPLRLERGMDDISINAPAKVKGGDLIDVQLHVVENNSGMDRDFDLATKLPKGLTLVPGSVSVNNASQKANLSVDGQTIRIAGVQEDSAEWMPNYQVTDSDTDPMCRVPDYGRNDKGFVGLKKNYGINPSIGGKADDWAGMMVNGAFVNPFEIKLANYWGTGATLSLFNNGMYKKYDRFIVSPQGYVFFGKAWNDYQHLVQTKFPYYMNPYGPFIAPFWRGQLDANSIGFTYPVEALSTPLALNGDPAKVSGIAMAYTNDEMILEWMNARTERFTFNQFGAKPTNPETIRDDRYTFNLVMNRNYRYGAGEYEVVMAYDTMNFGTQQDFGSIGLHGHHGALDVLGIPYRQETGIQYAYDGLKDKVKQNKVVCWDYTGPEATQFDVSFKVRVAETAAGQTLNMDWISLVTGLDQVTMTKALQVAGTITLPEFKDLSVDENKTVDFHVLFADSENDAKVITVTGSNVASTISNHENNAKVTLTPNKDWHGKTTITVTVADKLVPTDKASQSFELTVKSDGVEPVVVTPQPEPKPAPAKSSGGAGGGLLLALLPLLWLRRRKQV